MFKVSVIGNRKVLGTSITIPIEMLNAADLINRIEGGKQERLALQLLSMDGGNIQLNAGLELVSRLSLADIDDTDMVISAGTCGAIRWALSGSTRP